MPTAVPDVAEVANTPRPENTSRVTPAVAAVMKEKVGDQLKNIDDLLVRDECKVRIYSEY